MNMRKIFGYALLAAMLAVPLSAAQAGFGFKVGAATVLDVTTTACTTGDNQTVDMFGNGVSMDQVWRLQKEVGSPGSGSWEAVEGFRDVFPAINGSAAVGGVTQVARYTSDKAACFRLHMGTDTAGTGQIQIVTNRRDPSALPGRSTHVTHFNDFFSSVLDVAALGNGGSMSLLSFTGDGTGSAVIGIGESSPEGIMTFTGGDDGDAADAAEVTFSLAAQVGLVSDGLTIFEVRSSVEDITAGVWSIGLTEDVVTDSTEDPEHVINTNVVTDLAACNSCISFSFSSDAVFPTLLQAVSTNATAIGNAADEYTLGNAPVAATYQILRIEIDATGDAYWYVDGVLMGAEPLAVGTAATLGPFFVAGSADDCTTACGVTKVDVDYMYFIVPRPSGT